jgi:glyoxylase-like metal-dependent hydrolase (beta-lactamase superfamily II)
MIYTASIQLTDVIPQHVHLVKGERYAVWIDSGVKAMFPRLVETMAQAGVRGHDVRFILHTHSHHDHIGCNAQMQDRTGCLIAAPSHYATWHADFERHYQEFARPFPNLVPDTPALRDEVLSILDAPRPLGLHLDEGIVFDLGNITLEAFSLPGHLLAELGYLEASSHTLILGDAITGIDWPIFHSHLSVQGYRDSLTKITRIVRERDVHQILFAHYPPMTPLELSALIAKANAYIDEIEMAIIHALASDDAVTLEQLWAATCAHMNRTREFRALNMVHAHVQDLMARGFVREIGEQIYRIR